MATVLDRRRLPTEPSETRGDRDLGKEGCHLRIDFEALPEVIGIIGSRTATRSDDRTPAEQKLLTGVDRFVGKLKKGTSVVSGGARGVDRTAALSAAFNGLAVEEYPVTDEEWRTRGKGAGHARNAKIVGRVKLGPGLVVAFALSDERGEITPGTRNALYVQCKRLDVPWLLYRVDVETAKWLAPKFSPTLALHDHWRRILIFDEET